MIKIGLIGAGFMGMTHSACYEALQHLFDFQITAVADADPEKAHSLAEKFGAVVYASGLELIAQADVNTIDICLPTFMHTSHALLAMDKGYDVFIEKPVCLNEIEAQQLLEAQQKSGVKVMVGQCIRFWPQYDYIKSIQMEQTYGKLISAVFKRVSPQPTWSWNNWLHDKSLSGSSALDLHIHDVDFVRYLLGQPDSISSDAVTKDNHINHIFSVYKYVDVRVSIEGTWDYPQDFPFEMEYRVKFETATVVYSSAKSPSHVVYLNEGGHFIPQLLSEALNESKGSVGNISEISGYVNELHYFLSQLSRGQAITNASLEDGIESFRLTMRDIAAALNY